MSLLKHNNSDSGEKKPLLTRGPKIKAKNTVKRSDINEPTLQKEKDSKILTTVTEPVNIRVDNHIRNKVAALITLGYGSSQKEIVENLLDSFIESIDIDEKRFNDLLEIYEEKDVKNYYKKKHKKK